MHTITLAGRHLDNSPVLIKRRSVGGSGSRRRPVCEHDDWYPFQPGPVDRVLGALACVYLEGQQLIRHIYYVLIPEIIRGDTYYLRSLGVFNQAARLGDGL